MSHSGATLSLHIQARACLVLPVYRHQPPHADQAGPTRPHGYHRHLDRRGNQVAHRGSAPPRRRRPARGRKGDQGVRLSPNKGPARHTDVKRYQRNLHSGLAASHNLPLPQREECDGPPSQFFPDLRRGKSLLAHLLLSVPPPREHPCHTRPRRANRTFVPFLTSPPSAKPVNAQQRAMRIQVLLSMGQYCLSKEEAGELLDQRVHILASTQELRRLKRNFVKLMR